MPLPTHRPLIADGNFLRLWFAGAFAATARWLEMLAVGIFVFEVTASAALVAATLMLRMLPMGLFGVFGGEIADRFDRRRILLTTLALMFGVAVAVGSLAYFERLAVWQVGLAAFVAGLAWVVDFPVRRTLLADAVGSSRLGSAMSLDTVASSGTRMVGPLLGGALYAAAGMVGAFLLSAVAYALAFVILLGLPPIAGHGTVMDGKVTHRIRDGLRILRRVPVLQGVLAVTVVFNVWGFPIISMVPVIGADVLYLAPFEVGVLASMEGLGSLLGALALAAFARNRQYRLLYFFGVFTYLAGATVFRALLGARPLRCVAAASRHLHGGVRGDAECAGAPQHAAREPPADDGNPVRVHRQRPHRPSPSRPARILVRRQRGVHNRGGGRTGGIGGRGAEVAGACCSTAGGVTLSSERLDDQ